MQAPICPPDETARLKALRDLLVLDTPPEERFDLLTAYAAAQFSVPIALVSLVDEGRQWFKSRCGLDAQETPRDISFCGHALLRAEVFIVADTLQDPRFVDNPLVTSEPKIRFYAGAPITLRSGYRVGTFCLIDRHPRHLEDHEIAHLRDLATVVAQELEGDAATAEFLRHHSSRAIDRAPNLSI